MIRAGTREFTVMPADNSLIHWVTNKALVLIIIIIIRNPPTTLEVSLVIKSSAHLVQRTRPLGLTVSGSLFLPSPPSRTRNPPLMRVNSE